MAVGGHGRRSRVANPAASRWRPCSSVHNTGDDVYRLYAVSNAASFLALLSYPVAIEPWISVQHQFWIWSAGYVVYIVLAIRAALDPTAASTPAEPALPISARETAYWLALAACGSTMLLAVTNQMCQEVAVIPFLWILPLALYLLTFTVCFDHPRWYNRRAFGLALAILAPVACALAALSVSVPVWPHILVDTLTLVAVCMVCHGELAASKPARGNLTRFYLTVSAGGALGGVFVAAIAPRIFTDFTEFPLAMAAACALALIAWYRSGTLLKLSVQPMLTQSAIAGLVMAAFLGVDLAYGGGDSNALAATRNFYGILRLSGAGNVRTLTHGRTIHGFQYQDAVHRDWPTAYFGPDSALGLVMDFERKSSRRIGVIGLGVGTAAAYGRAGDTIRFYEINPAVDRISADYFTFRREALLRNVGVEVIPGDARLVLATELSKKASPPQYDVLAVDAFTSDAIPAHLLTSECAAIYRRHLRDDGVLLFHISNRTLDLAPVVRAIGARMNWRAARVISAAHPDRGEFEATWMIVSGNDALWQSPAIQQAINEWTPQDRPPLEWRDDFTSLWRVLRF